MADIVVTNEQIGAEISGIEADMSVILQFMRQLSEQGFVVEPDGLGVIEGMVFSTSLRLSKLGQMVTNRLTTLQKVVVTARDFITATEQDDAEIRELTALTRRAATLLHGAKSREEADHILATIREGLEAIDQRTSEPLEPVPAPTGGVVLQFTRPTPEVAQIVAEGGAA